MARSVSDASASSWRSSGLPARAYTIALGVVRVLQRMPDRSNAFCTDGGTPCAEPIDAPTKSPARQSRMKHHRAPCDRPQCGLQDSYARLTSECCRFLALPFRLRRVPLVAALHALPEIAARLRELHLGAHEAAFGTLLRHRLVPGDEIAVLVRARVERRAPFARA